MEIKVPEINNHSSKEDLFKALIVLIPKILGERNIEHYVIDHGSKSRLLKDVPDRLRAYKKRIISGEKIKIMMVSYVHSLP